MAKTIELDLPATFDVAARGKSVTVDMTKLTPAIIGQLVLHGLRQKVADAAASAKKVAEESDDPKADPADIGKGMMQAVVDSLEAGQWGTRVAATAVPTETKVRRTVVRELFNAKAGDEARKAFKEMDAEAQAKHLDALFDKQAEERKAAIMVDVAGRIKAMEAKAKQVAKLGEDFAI